VFYFEKSNLYFLAVCEIMFLHEFYSQTGKGSLFYEKVVEDYENSENKVEDQKTIWSPAKFLTSFPLQEERQGLGRNNFATKLLGLPFVFVFGKKQWINYEFNLINLPITSHIGLHKIRLFEYGELEDFRAVRIISSWSNSSSPKTLSNLLEFLSLSSEWVYGNNQIILSFAPYE
jgi:hypothetical protein